MPEYEKLNPEVVDSLFAFIDFDKFKKNILEFKSMETKNMDLPKGANDKIDDFEENEKMFHTLLKEDVNSNGWYKSLEQKEKNGFSAFVHQRPVEGKTLNVVRMESVLKGIKFETYDKILMNWEKYQKLYDSQNSQVSFRMVEPSKKEDGTFSMQCLARNKMGYMSSDRESLYRL